jgi:hypothetical protein
MSILIIATMTNNSARVNLTIRFTIDSFFLMLKKTHSKKGLYVSKKCDD